MPTLERWLQALAEPRRVKMISDDTLVNHVNSRPNSKTFTGTRKKATKINSISPYRDIYLSPAEILGSIGLITTPRIENLADISSTWARMRYIWAFNPSLTTYNDKLRLSKAAQEIDFHQKTLLSDEMGVGFANIIMERYFNGTNPVDVDVAFRKKIFKSLKKTGSSSPDYIFRHLGKRGSFFVVECKGTQTTYYQAVDQLARGTEQVPSVIIGKRAINPFVIATHLTKDFTNVYVVDPPSDQGFDFTIDEQDLMSFYNDILEEQRKNILRYIGALSISFSDNIEGDFEMRADTDFQQREEILFLGDTYLGTSASVRFPGERVDFYVFQGLKARLYSHYLHDDYDHLDEMLQREYHDMLQIFDFPGRWIGERRSVYVDQHQGGVDISYVRKEGTIFQISIRG